MLVWYIDRCTAAEYAADARKQLYRRAYGGRDLGRGEMRWFNLQLKDGFC